MATLQLKNLPDALHDALKRRAQQEGLSLTDLVTRMLQRELALPSAAEWLQSLSALPSRRTDLDISTVMDQVRSEEKPERCGMRVIDASALVDVLVRSPRGKRVAAELDGFAWIAPELVDVEVLSVLARLTRGGYLTVRHASAAAAALAAMPMRRISHAPLLPIAWTLRERVRVADGFYVACARMVGVPLLTTDRRLAAAPVPDVSVLVVH